MSTDTNKNMSDKESADQDGVLAERLLALKQSRSGAKASVTKHINEIKRFYDAKSLDDATRKLAGLSLALQDFKTAHDRYHDLVTEGNDKQESSEYYTEVTSRAQIMFDLIQEANSHDMPPTAPEHNDDILPNDSASQVQSNLSTTSSRARAAARSAAIQARLDSLQQIQMLEQQQLVLRQQADEQQLALKQQSDALKMAVELKASRAEEEALSEHSSTVIGDKDNIYVSKDKADTKIEESVNKDIVKPQGKGLNPNAPEFNYVSPDNQTMLKLIQQSQEQQQQMLNSIQLPKAELITFDGDPMQYWTFINAFENNVGCTSATESAKLTRLLQYCSGKARKAIESCQMVNPKQGYNKALKILSDRFGNSYIIAETWIGKLMDGPSVTSNDKDAVQELADELRNCVECLKAMGHLEEINTQRVMATLVQRLPEHLHGRWLREVQRQKAKSSKPHIEHLVTLIESFASEVNDPVFGCLYSKGSKGKEAHTGLFSPKHKGNGKHSTFSIQEGKPEGSKNPVTSCIVCDGKHSLFGCDQFKSLNVEKRRQLVYENKLCFNCLLPDHMSQNCNLKRTCTVNGCGKKHTKFLHLHVSSHVAELPTERQDAPTVQATKKTGSVGHASRVKAARVSLPVIPVKIRATGTSRWVETSALLDNGSTTTFCAEHLIRQLGIKGEHDTMALTTLTDDSKNFSTTVVNLELSSTDSVTTLPLGEVFTVQHLPIKRDNVATQDDINRHDHLRHLDIRFGNADNVGLLIGQDNSHLLKPLDVSQGDEVSPYATRTVLGWTVNGILGEAVAGSRMGTANFIRADTELNRQVERFWEIEANEDDSEGVSMSVNDKQVIEFWKSSLERVGSHYEFPIPFKQRPLQLPNNRGLAEKRLCNLGRRLLKDDDLKTKYKSGIDDLIAKGYAEKLTNLSHDKGAVWYLPHHPVTNPHKPEKVRIVFDCASKYNGTSLNDNVLQGPDLTSKLVGVLLRFRVGPVAVKADIEAMFHQVQVGPEDKDVLRFLWWKDGDVSQPLEEYRMTVHLFGGVWSPSCANYALRRTAEDNIGCFDDETIQTVRKNFYVDDCLKSTVDTDSAIRLVSQLCDLLKKGGFRLTKWVSNSRGVLKTVPDAERAKEVQNLDLDNESLPVDRALGVNWNVDADAFMFQIRILEKPLTRRGILSMLSSVYDPLGFLVPYTLRAKIVFQDLCRLQLGWDEKLPCLEKERWCKWALELPLLETFKVDRCFVPPNFGEVIFRQLHHFSDASEKALGTVSFLRLLNANGEIHISFLIAKSRLAPLKMTTIPRLELCSAALAVKVDGLLRRELDFPVHESRFWSDSTIALGYIRNRDKRFKTFVANRVSAIHKGSDVGQWCHIDGKLNPADEASRGLSAEELLNNQRWLKGPPFLWNPEETWPHWHIEDGIVAEDDPEVKQQSHAYATDIKPSMTPAETLVSYYSSWTKLKRAVAIFEKFAIYTYQRYCADEAKDELRRDYEKSFNLAFDVADLESAEIGILKFAQSRAFSADIAALSSPNDKRLPKSSSIHRLDPFMKDGIVRVGGRLERAEINEGLKHPILLPKKSHITSLLVRSCHEKLGHVGRNHVISTLREKYWIINMNSVVRHVLSSCVTCKRLWAPPMEQKMADLPFERVNAAPPFTHIGVDYFGPYLIKEGRKEYKRYGVLFTCLASRAIHIETANSLTTDSFIDAFRRFQARRGPVRTIYSDNGTNFTGAERELRECLTEMDTERIGRHLLNANVDWKFNPPTASHQGGVWERQIRSVRKVLAPMLLEHGQRLDDESYRTLMCEVEAIVNSRPLTTISSDTDDLNPLSPSQILTMKSKLTYPPAGVFGRNDVYLRQKWRRVQYMANLFWTRWTKEYLTSLQSRQKWTVPRRNTKIDDIVLIKDDNLERSQWLLGRVDSLEPDSNGFVRSAMVKANGQILRRPVQKLVLLVPSD